VRAARLWSWLLPALVVAVALSPRLATPLDVPPPLPRAATASSRASTPTSAASAAAASGVSEPGLPGLGDRA
jgi:hypothetical protein